MSIQSEYEKWLQKAVEDKDLIDELKSMDEAKKEDAFYRDLEFGTGGLRGVIGAGTNRMNVYTVAKASQGLANYVKEHGGKSIAVSRDSRIKSELFSKKAAEVFAGNGLEVHIFTELMPTPCLSYAVRYLQCDAGIMVTASHNPSKYNGYKVYNEAGCQITTDAADEILKEIEKIDLFKDIKSIDFEEGLKTNKIHYIDDACYDAFIKEVNNQSVLFGDVVDKNVSIVYSPLNGTGLKPVTRALKESGFTNLFVVPEQAMPDGNFPTCPYPNPEIKEALKLGLQYAKEKDADLLLATDPDCDRVGIAVKNKNGEHVLVTGNEVGMLLLDYLCARKTAHNSMPKNPIMVKTIVSIDMAEQIAKHYGVETINVLTGFKFIGEQIGLLEEKNEKERYILGFEESYGYLSGTYVRDKDAVNAAFLICEMFVYYKGQGISLLDKLEELYKTYGYCMNTLYSFEFAGSVGFAKMQELMQNLRSNMDTIGNKKVIKVLDYDKGIDGLPKSNVLKFLLKDNCSVVVRPSGTEPKIKIYISVSDVNREEVQKVEKIIYEDISKKMKA